MDIRKEYRRLVEAASTKGGWQKINAVWQIATNHEWRNGYWYKKNSTGGNQVAGFAIDTRRWIYKVGVFGGHHELPKMEVTWEIENNEDPEPGEIGERVIDGRLARSDQWAFPLAMVFGLNFSAEDLDKIEAKILDWKLGLPIRKLAEHSLSVK